MKSSDIWYKFLHPLVISFRCFSDASFSHVLSKIVRLRNPIYIKCTQTICTGGDALRSA